MKVKKLNNPAAKAKEISKRDGENCFYCARFVGDDYSVEHLLALVLGGNNKLENLVLSHRHCNVKASILLPKDKHLLAKAIQEKDELQEQKLLRKARLAQMRLNYATNLRKKFEERLPVIIKDEKLVQTFELMLSLFDSKEKNNSKNPVDRLVLNKTTLLENLKVFQI